MNQTKINFREGEDYEFFRAIQTIDDLRGREATDALLLELGLSRKGERLSGSYEELGELVTPRLTLLAQKRFGIQGLGFHVAKHTHVTDLGLFGYAMLTAPTIGKALEIGVRYNRRFSEFTDCTIESLRDGVAFRFFVRGSLMPYTAIQLEQWMAIAWHFLAQLSPDIQGGDLKKVHLSYTAPKYSKLYQQYYGASILFEQPFSEFVFEKKFLTRSIGTASVAAGEILAQQCDRVFSQLKREGGIVDAVRREIMKNVGSDRASLNDVAKSLALSSRTLRRRLLEKGTSFKKIALDVRMALAKEYVYGTDMSNEEISYALGYAQTSAFYRSFQRWHGITPSKMRKKDFSSIHSG